MEAAGISLEKCGAFAPRFFAEGSRRVLDKESYVLRLAGAAAVCLAVMILAGPLGRLMSIPEIASLVVYLETGRVVKLQLTPPAETLLPETLPQATEAPIEKPVFLPEDAQQLRISYHWDCELDTQALLLSELSWDLTDPGPQVLILHSHATESYTPTQEEPYTPSSEYRTLDPEHNMLRVGSALKAALESRGIGVILDTTLHDYPSYPDAYIRSRETAQRILEEYPTISLVLDLHRDAAELEGGGQLGTHISLNGKDCAQLMLVVGTNGSGRQHPNWRENMALALKLQTQLEKLYPGACRPIGCRRERFNQDLSPGALLIEIGAAGDTLEEALNTVEILAEAIETLARGTATENSTN